MKKETAEALGTLPELYKNQELALLMPRDLSLKFLNVDPPSGWVKKHPFVDNHKYLPIDKVEFLLRVIFREFRIEILNCGMILNAVQCSVRVHYRDLTTGEWMYHDGIAAIEPQTAKGTGVLKLDMSNINKGAMSMAVPIAKSLAIKDACDHLGTVFGANLNRKDAINFNETSVSITDKRMSALIEAATTMPELEQLRSHLTEVTNPLFEEKWNLLSGVAQ